MRVISGRLKGRKLNSFKGSAVRPTSDRVREALFSILAHTPTNATVLDLYAGTGALGIEALSRGAKRVLFIDNAPQALSLIQKNIQLLALEVTATIIRWNAAVSLDCLLDSPQAVDLAFLDPPYGRNLVPVTMAHLLSSGCLSPGATIVAEHEPLHGSEPLSDAYGITDQRRYGQTCLTFYRFQPER